MLLHANAKTNQTQKNIRRESAFATLPSLLSLSTRLGLSCVQTSLAVPPNLHKFLQPTLNGSKRVQGNARLCKPQQTYTCLRKRERAISVQADNAYLWNATNMRRGVAVQLICLACRATDLPCLPTRLALVPGCLFTTCGSKRKRRNVQTYAKQTRMQSKRKHIHSKKNLATFGPALATIAHGRNSVQANAKMCV